MNWLIFNPSAVSNIKSRIITAEDAKVAKKFLENILRTLCVLSALCGELVRTYLKNKSTVNARSKATKQSPQKWGLSRCTGSLWDFVPIRNIGRRLTLARIRNDIHRGFCFWK